MSEMTVLEESFEEEFLGEMITEDMLMKHDLALFAEVMLNMEISNHHIIWAKMVAENPKLGINAPRDHGKSFLFSFAYVIWRVYYNWLPTQLLSLENFKSVPRISIGYIFSNTVDQAVLLLDLVKQEIESNERLQHLIPARKDVWSKTAVKFSNGAQVRARGWNQSVRGAHPVWIVCDDVLKDEIIYSEVQRKKYNDYFFSAVTPMLVPCGQLIVVGTPMHQDDLYAQIQLTDTYKFQKFKAMENGIALWPTRYNRKMLEERKKEVGSTRFAREYMCEPITDDTALFTDRIITQCSDNMYEMPTELTDEDRRHLRIYTGVDLAISSTVGADWSVILTIGVDDHDHRYILDIVRKRGLQMTEQLMLIQDVYKRFKPIKVKIESNGFQRVFTDSLTRNTAIPVEAHTTTRINKNHLADGVPGLQVLFENRKWTIPRKTARCREKTQPIIDELKAFTFTDGKLQGLGAHDDCVMALWIANSCVGESQFSFSMVGESNL